MPEFNETIAAIATPSGRGGVGIIRVSGNQASRIYKALTGKTPEPRVAKFVSFNASDKTILDKGIALFFVAPASYTGEDVMECHAHGNRIVLGMLLEEIISLGARAARPGEFTERAFVNNKIDLVQAEAVADLIDSNSKKAARSAMQSLDGVFSDSINKLRDRVFNAKALIEAALDFPEEEGVDINTSPATKDIQACLDTLNNLLNKAEAGRVLDQNPTVVIVGRPNAGKSSIINYLSGYDSAIVSKIPGTTRDIIKEKVLIGDYAVTLLDTAGIRETHDEIEQIGVDKARQALGIADIVLYIQDNTDDQLSVDHRLFEYGGSGDKTIVVKNKIDLCKGADFVNSDKQVYVSAKTSQGMDKLVELICNNLDITENEEDLIFSRQRHVETLHKVKNSLQCVLTDMENDLGLEVQAESLRQCLACFDDLTGRITSDDVLGAVFSKFCIGK